MPDFRDFEGAVGGRVYGRHSKARQEVYLKHVRTAELFGAGMWVVLLWPISLLLSICTIADFISWGMSYVRGRRDRRTSAGPNQA